MTVQEAAIELIKLELKLWGCYTPNWGYHNCEISFYDQPILNIIFLLSSACVRFNHNGKLLWVEYGNPNFIEDINEIVALLVRQFHYGE